MTEKVEDTISGCQPVSIEEILQMTNAGIGEDVIIKKIKSCETNYDLSVTRIIELHEKGVKDKVLEAMVGKEVKERPAHHHFYDPWPYPPYPWYCGSPYFCPW